MTGPTGSTSATGVMLADRYELVRHIARGGMGEVYEATDHQLGRQVAVKCFRAASPEELPRFEAEILLLARLNHPGLVQVYDAGEHDGDSFVVLELVDGPPLRAVLQERGPIPAAELATMGAALADALAYVHANGVVHRDVTPANVLCGPDGRPRLADFGIARLLDSARVTAAANTIGTAAYMAPEQVEGRDVTPAADVYSLGLLLLEALTGRPAFEGTGSEVAVARLARDPDTATGVPPAWSGLLAAMTTREPADRPDAPAVRDRLATLAAPPPASGVAVAGAGGVDPHADTATIPVAGGTAVMPVALRPEGRAAPVSAPAGEARPARPAPARAFWVVTGVAVALVLLLASLAGGGIDVPTTTVPAAEAPSTTAPATTIAPTTTAPPADDAVQGEGRGEGKGKGNGNGKGDDDDD